MSITIPMWFIYFWAFCLVVGLVNAFRSGKKLAKLGKQVADITAPKLEESLAESISNSLSVQLNNKINDEYIVVKKPIRKAKKEEVKDAEVH